MRFFFHLSFGDRFLPDEEGMELSSRAAARREALAVVGDLSDRVADRWGGWFLRIADQDGEFLSLPIGHPALELVSDGVPQHRSATRGRKGSKEVSSSDRAQADSLHGQAAALFEQASALREHTARLLERNRQLRSEVSSQFLFNRAVGDRARQLISYARLATSSEDQIPRTAAQPASPHLVVLPGGKMRPPPG